MTAPTRDCRRWVIDRALGSVANDYLRRGARRGSEADAAAFLKDRLRHSGYCGPTDPSWAGCPSGIAYDPTGDDCLPQPEDGHPVVRWRELAAAARGVEQLTLEAQASGGDRQ